jgi:lambda family phage minor tail protein L
MSNITQVVQNPTPGQYVSMFSLDTTSLGGSVMYFCQATANNSGVTFRGIYYTPVDFEATGFEYNGVGGLPTPKLKVANSNQVFQAIINTYGDLVGCPVSRIRTFSQFLDGASQADSTAYFGPDLFQVERKTSENPIFIEWELSAALDVQGAMIPKRMVIRDTCTWRYRAYNSVTQAFDYTKAQCPYVGATMFDAAGNTVTDPTKDVCSRNVAGCKLRFGTNGNLPYGGFPGVARFQ